MNKERQIQVLNKIIECLDIDYKEMEFMGKLGLCRVINYLHSIEYLSNWEYWDIQKFIFDNKPTKDNKYAEFTNNDYWIDDMYNYWWCKIRFAPETRQIRIDFIKALINNIK